MIYVNRPMVTKGNQCQQGMAVTASDGMIANSVIAGTYAGIVERINVGASLIDPGENQRNIKLKLLNMAIQEHGQVRR